MILEREVGWALDWGLLNSTGIQGGLSLSVFFPCLSVTLLFGCLSIETLFYRPQKTQKIPLALYLWNVVITFSREVGWALGWDLISDCPAHVSINKKDFSSSSS